MQLGNSALPDGLRVYAIGDIHGCLAELNELLGLIDADVANHPAPEHRLVFLGDYIDRGPDSSGVLSRLATLASSRDNCVFLKGNHDQYLWKFLVDPVLVSVRHWMAYGGVETVASYGFNYRDPDQLTLLQPVFAKRVPCAHIRFLEQRVPLYNVGDYFFAHAGVDPTRSLYHQHEDDLLWIRGPFLNYGGTLEKVVVHGHTPNPNGPEFVKHRINADTEAYGSGKLTAIVLEGANYRHLQTQP